MNNLIQTYKQLSNTQLLLKYTYGLLFVVAGLDKFFNIITLWPKYVSPFVLQAFHTDISTLIIIIAAIEIILGLLVLTKHTRLGAYGIAIWFGIIALNLLTMGAFFDIAVRDIVLAIGAVALAWLTEIKNGLKV